MTSAEYIIFIFYAKMSCFF